MKKSQKWKRKIKALILPKGKRGRQKTPKKEDSVYKGAF